MFSDSRVEFEKGPGTWRIVATGWPALGISFVLGIALAAPLVKWLEHNLT